MREQLTRLENMNIFQKPKGNDHDDTLRTMKKRVELIEKKAEGYPGMITWFEQSEDTSDDGSTVELTHAECKVSELYITQIVFLHYEYTFRERSERIRRVSR